MPASGNRSPARKTTVTSPSCTATPRWGRNRLHTDAPGHLLTDWHLENVYEIYPQWRKRYAPGVVFNTEHLFGLAVPAGMPVVLSPREHTDCVWLPWREAAGRCSSASNAEAILQLPRLASCAA